MKKTKLVALIIIPLTPFLFVVCSGAVVENGCQVAVQYGWPFVHGKTDKTGYQFDQRGVYLRESTEPLVTLAPAENFKPVIHPQIQLLEGNEYRLPLFRKGSDFEFQWIGLVLNFLVTCIFIYGCLSFCKMSREYLKLGPRVSLIHAMILLTAIGVGIGLLTLRYEKATRQHQTLVNLKRIAGAKLEVGYRDVRPIWLARLMNRTQPMVHGEFPFFGEVADIRFF